MYKRYFSPWSFVCVAIAVIVKIIHTTSSSRDPDWGTEAKDETTLKIAQPDTDQVKS